MDIKVAAEDLVEVARAAYTVDVKAVQRLVDAEDVATLWSMQVAAAAAETKAQREMDAEADANGCETEEWMRLAIVYAVRGNELRYLDRARCKARWGDYC